MDTFKECLIKGERNLKNKKISLAIADFTMAININPNSDRAYLRRARAKIYQKEFSSAISDCDKAIAINSKYSSAYYWRGIAKYSLEDYHSAITDFNMIEELMDSFLYDNALRLRGQIWLKLNDYDAAIVEYVRYLKAIQDSYNSHLYEARENASKPDKIYMDAVNPIHRMIQLLGNIDNPSSLEAMANYSNALKYAEKLCNAYNEIINIKLAKKDYSGVIADSTRMIDLIFEIQKVQFEKSEFTMRFDTEESNEDFMKSLTPNQRIVNAFSKRGLARCFVNEYSKAIADFNKVLEYEPENHQVIFNRGNTKAKLNDLAGAVTDFSKAIELNSKFVGAYHNRGIARIKMNIKELGLNDLKEAERLGDPKAKDLIAKYDSLK